MRLSRGLVLTQSLVSGATYLVDNANAESIVHLFKAALVGASTAMQVISHSIAQEEREERERLERERADRPNETRMQHVEQQIRELRQALESLYKLASNSRYGKTK